MSHRLEALQLSNGLTAAATLLKWKLCHVDSMFSAEVHKIITGKKSNWLYSVKKKACRIN